MQRLDPPRKQLQDTFNAELAQRVGALTALLQALQRDGHSGQGGRARAETFDALFREAHSLKGAARAVELDEVERWAHQLETALGVARQSAEPLDSAWLDAAYQAVDTFSRLAAHEHGMARPEFPALLTAPQARAHAGVPAEPGPPAEPAHVAPGAQGLKALASETSAPAGRARASSMVPQASAPASPGSAESIRVPVAKLDTLLAQAGELAVTRIRIGQRLEELNDLQQTLYDWRRDWRVCRGLRATLRRSAGTDRAGGVEGQAGRVPTHAPGAGVAAGDLDGLLRFTERAEEQVQAVSRQVDELAAQLRRDVAQLGLVTQGMADEVLAARLLPVGTVFDPFERMVRDLARVQGKDIHLLLEGRDVEVDRKILEQLRDPLMHMVRNAVDHGIEHPDERTARGKPRTGVLRLAALQRGNAVEIEVEDDGAGLDAAALRQSAIEKGFVPANEAMLDDQAALELIFQPGVSTSATVTDISGRGVGMDVVREHVERLNG